MENLEQLEVQAKALEERMQKIEAQTKELDAAKLDIINKGQNMTPTVGQRSNSDEAKALVYFGVSHVKDLLSVNVGAEKFARVPDELKYLVLELKKSVDISRLQQQILGGQPLDREEQPAHVKGMLDSYYGKNILAPRIKAFGSTVSGAGDEWVPTGISSNYIEEYQLVRAVAENFRQINMPTNPFDLPVQTNKTKARIQAEGGGLAGTNFGTTKISFNAANKLTEFYPLTEELNEDSAPAILELARQDVVTAQISAIESAIVNGCTGTHMDADTEAGSAIASERIWNGLVKLGMDNSANGGNKSFAGAVASITLIRDMRAKMKKYGVNALELVWIVSPKTYNQFMGITEVTTVDKMGPNATIIKGSLANIDGIPIVISEYMRDDVAATGYNTALGPNTFSRILLVNKNRFYVGQRRPIRVKAIMDPTPPNDSWLICSWSRHDFKGHAQGASEVSVCVGYNIL